MSAPVLWILIPAVASVGLFALQRWPRVCQLIGVGLVVVLAWLAWRVPIGEPIDLRLWRGFSALTISESLTILGRQFILGQAIRPALIMIYLGVGLWMGGASAARSSRLFTPLALGMAALLTASLAVAPALYAALIIELSVLVSAPLLCPPGKPVGAGVLRFLIFQTVGMAMILFGDWLLTQAELASPVDFTGLDSSAILQSALVIGLGFAFMIAVFPFHTWFPMLAENSPPYAAAFIFFILPTAIFILGLDYLNRYMAMGVFPAIFMALRLVGGLTMLTGGIGAAFERHLGRILGFAAMTQVGGGLMAIGLADQLNPGAPAYGASPVGIFFAQRIPLGIGLVIWSLALSILKAEAPDLRFHSVQGLARRLPIASASLILANFSLAGLPLLASFPSLVALLSALAQQSVGVAFAALAGSACLFVAGLRTLAVLAMDAGRGGSETHPYWRVTEKWTSIVLLVVGWLITFVVGLTPQWFFPYMASMAHVFMNPR